MAQERTIRTVLELNVSKFQANAARAGAAAKGLASELDAASRASQNLDKNAAGYGKAAAAARNLEQSYSRVGTTMLGAGTAMAAGLGVAVKAAMDWESAWAGVKKTVDGTPQQMAELEGELRGLAKTLPATHTEIAGVAEAAGQLGVSRENVASFTKTMIDLGESTNLTAEEAATSLARFSNIMGTSVNNVDNLGSTLVGLGNNFATTESEILAMGMRLAGTGRQMNMTEGDVLGLAAAMSSVGIEAEAGGTAMSTVLKKMDAAVREGGDGLAGFAEVAGVSAEKFAAAWRESPSKALEMFVGGLNQVQAAGGSVASTLKELGIKGIREQDTMLRLAGAHDELAKALAAGNEEFLKNTALLTEANQRYETAESRMRIAFNRIVDAGISLGSSLLPVFAQVAEGAASLADAFNSLPGPVKSIVGTLGTVGSVALLAGGGLMKLVPAVRDSVEAFKTFSTSAPKATKAFKAFAGVLGAVGIVHTLSSIGSSMKDFSLTADEMAINTLKLADSANVYDTLFQGMNHGIKDAEHFAFALENMANPNLLTGLSDLEGGLERLIGVDTVKFSEGADRMREVGRSLAELASTDFSAAQASFRGIWEAGDKTEATWSNLLKVMPDFRGKLVAIAEANKITASESNLLGIALGEIPVKVDATGKAFAAAEPEMSAAQQATQALTEANDELMESLSDIGNAFLGVRGAAREYEDQMKAAAEAAKENGKHWEDGTKGARDNAEALDSLASSSLSYLEALEKNNQLTSASMQKARDDIMHAAEAFGATKDQAAAYADQLGLTPETIQTKVDLEVQQAQQGIDNYVAKFGEVPPSVLTQAELEKRAAIDSLDVWTGEVAKANGETIQTDVVLNSNQALATAEEVQAELNKFPELVNVVVNADTSGLQTKVKAADLQLAYIGAQSPEPKLGLNDKQLKAAGAAAEARLKELDGMKPTPALRAEKRGLERVVKAAKGDLKSVKDKNVKVTAKTQGKGDVDALRNSVAGLHSKDISVRITTFGMNALAAAKRAAGLAHGGWVAPGRSSGGWVPGGYPGPGVDNVLWPFAPGAARGRYLAQPLAGDEYVVNGAQARKFGPVLEFINNGASMREFANAVSARGNVTVKNTFHGLNRESAEIAAEQTLGRVLSSVRGLV
ncbi:MAG: phage tail tape measure protein [Dermabacter sp.]|nr:phage tail tape measure protein [Dermabacter sp.]